MVGKMARQLSVATRRELKDAIRERYQAARRRRERRQILSELQRPSRNPVRSVSCGPWRSKNAQTIEPRGASRFELEAAVEAERKVWKRRSEPRLNRLRPVSALSTGALSALTGECFEF